MQDHVLGGGVQGPSPQQIVAQGNYLSDPQYLHFWSEGSEYLLPLKKKMFKPRV